MYDGWICTGKLLISEDETQGTWRATSGCIQEVLQELIAVGISDHEPEVRRAVLKAFTPKYNDYLSQVRRPD